MPLPAKPAMPPTASCLCPMLSIFPFLTSYPTLLHSLPTASVPLLPHAPHSHSFPTTRSHNSIPSVPTARAKLPFPCQPPAHALQKLCIISSCVKHHPRKEEASAPPRLPNIRLSHHCIKNAAPIPANTYTHRNVSTPPGTYT